MLARLGSCPRCSYKYARRDDIRFIWDSYPKDPGPNEEIRELCRHCFKKELTRRYKRERKGWTGE